MMKINLHNTKRLTHLFVQPYPFYYKGYVVWKLAALLFLMTLLFCYIFEPFEVYVPEHKISYFWISLIHAFTPVIIIAVISFIKPSAQTEDDWNVRNEILLVALFLLMVGITQFLIRDLIYNNPNNWSWRYFYEEIRNTFLIGSLFAVILISLNANKLKRKNDKSAKMAVWPLKVAEPLPNSILHIRTQVKSDDFILDVNNFLFAKASGNYTELYLNLERENRLLKRITIKDLESTLKPISSIVKTHRSYLVNIHHISGVEGNAQGYKLKLNNYNGYVPVSRNMIEVFNDKLKEL